MKMSCVELKNKIQTRSIEVSSYEQDHEKLVIEGELKDRHLNPYRLATGEKKPPGVVHHLTIRLLLDVRTFQIEDVEVRMLQVPHEECLKIAGSLSPIRGLTVTNGLISKVRELAGNVKGCSHLTALLSSMVSAAFQGLAAYYLQKPSGLEPIADEVLRLLLNTCWSWRMDGPLVKEYQNQWLT
jgi:hypothetical protein